MIYPIRAYGDPVLRKECEEIGPDHEGLSELIQNMYQTMDESDGVGLAAPQIGRSLRLFVVDSTHFQEKDEKGIRKAFINPIMIEELGDQWEFEEGCLSIPEIRENVSRNPKIKIKYQDENLKEFTEEFEGLTARVIQHEYDHIEGILFIDHLSAFKKQLIKGKLTKISKGDVNVRYKMTFPKRR